MAKDHFRFKQFTVWQQHAAMKVCADACVFGAWAIRSLPEGAAVLDMGAGTGLLSLMVAQRYPDANITAVEYDAGAFRDLTRNSAEAPFVLNTAQADVLSWVQGHQAAFDAIITNPPFYIGQLKGPNAARTQAHHMPTGGHQDWLEAADLALKPNGTLAILLPPEPMKPVVDWCIAHGYTIARTLHLKHDASKPVFRVMHEFLKTSSAPSFTAVEELCIYSAPRQFSEAYAALLRGYYTVF